VIRRSYEAVRLNRNGATCLSGQAKGGMQYPLGDQVDALMPVLSLLCCFIVFRKRCCIGLQLGPIGFC